MHTVLIWQQSTQIRDRPGDCGKIFQVCECPFVIILNIVMFYKTAVWILHFSHKLYVNVYESY